MAGWAAAYVIAYIYCRIWSRRRAALARTAGTRAVGDTQPARMSRLGPLPPISVSMDVKPEAAAPSRSAEQQADLDFELDALHRSLGVKRGDALKEALKPKLECPMPPIELATPPIGEGISCHAPVVPAAQTNTEPAEDALR